MRHLPEPLDSLPVVEREWITLLRKLRLTKGFLYIVYFSGDGRITQELKRRLREKLLMQSTPLTEISIESAAELAPATLTTIFKSAALPVHRDACAPFWIEASRHPGDPVWDDARRELLMRMNERRSRFENEVRCPMILVLPAGFQRDAASAAPDLWHIRVYSSALAQAPLIGRDPAPKHATDDALDIPAFLRRGVQRSDAPPALARTSAPPESVAVDYFRQRGKQVAASRGMLARVRAWLGSETVANREFSLADGWRAVDEALAQRALDDASDIALETLAAARLQQGPQAPRDLWASLDKAGEVALALGRFDAAAAAFEEMLTISRRLHKGYDETAQARHELSQSLYKIGGVALAQGRLDAAAGAFEESLMISRHALKDFGETPQALRDLSAVLDGLGNVAVVRGWLDAATAAFEESLVLHRKLLTAYGETDLEQGALSLSLARVGELALAQGRLDAASSAFEESLLIFQRRFDDHGATPQTLEDMVSVLERLADANPVSARRYWRGAHEIALRLAITVQGDQRGVALRSRLDQLAGKLGEAR